MIRNRFRATDPDTVDPDRLDVATHELGHLVVWEPLPGARVATVRVTGRGNGVEGLVRMDWPEHDTPELVRGYLVGLLAGREADRIRRTETGGPYDPSGCAHDFATFRRVRRQHAPSRQWSEGELRAEAHRLVRAHWPRIHRLAPRLARDGYLPT